MYNDYFYIQLDKSTTKSNTYSVQHVITLCNEYVYIQQVLLHKTSNYSIQRVFTMYEEYLSTPSAIQRVHLH